MTKYILKTIDTIFVNKVKKQKKNLDEKIGAFSVIIDDIDAANDIIQRAIKFGLTTEKLVVKPIKNSSTLAFFFKGKYDFEYVDTALESEFRGLIPRLSAKNKKYTIINKLRAASEEKKSLRSLLGVRGKTLRELTILKRDLKKTFKNTYTDLFSDSVVQKKCVTCEDTYVRVSEHFVQIGTQFIAKNPNDLIVMR